MEKRYLSLSIKRGQHIEFSNGLSFYIKKGGSNNYRIDLSIPDGLIVERTDKFGPKEQSYEEWQRHLEEKKQFFLYNRSKAQLLEAGDEVDDDDAPSPA